MLRGALTVEIDEQLLVARTRLRNRCDIVRVGHSDDEHRVLVAEVLVGASHRRTARGASLSILVQVTCVTEAPL